MTTRELLQQRGAELLAQHGVAPAGDGARIRRLTCFDPLTGLPNRLLFREQLDLVLRVARRGQHSIALLLVELDDFHQVRLSLGHRRVEQLIKTVARRLEGVLREGDIVRPIAASEQPGGVARFAGSEFAVLLERIEQPDDALRVARRLREAVAAALEIDGVEVFPTLSIGIAMAPDDGAGAELMLERADLALGRAKELGRDQTEFYAAALDARATDRMEIEAGLRRALAESHLRLHYQPRVDAANGSTVAHEALMRWQHPERGLLLPSTFIEATEQNRLIVPMGSWALTEACRQAEAWRRAGFGALPVGVNASAVQVCRADFAATVSQALQSTGCPAHMLEVEVTETALLQDAAAALRSLSEVKTFGVRVAMDDFGTGYSSLSALRDFPFDVLKIDRSFVMRLPHDGRTAAITHGIIDLSRRLGLDVVAEGVESVEQRDFLADAGCTLMQGFLFARPMAPDVAFARLVG